MLRMTRVGAAAALALCGLAPLPAAAQQQQLERVEITGSALPRIDAETALPVQVLRRADIERSGATNAADLLQALPAMQRFTNEAASVGGGGLGFSGASIHNLAETRTLVLLNGRRLASFAGQYITGELAGVDLNTIPLAAIERVEILTDGASALYGADAIGGVVNFITRRNFADGEVAAGASVPRKGAQERRVSAVKGIGSLDADGFSLLLAGSHERRNALKATDRKFASTGVIPLTLDGRDVLFFNGSPRAIPGNIQSADANLVSPFFATNGSCPAGHFALPPTCYFDFTRELEILPERDRSSLFLSGTSKLTERHALFAEALLSKTQNTSRLAPTPGEVLVGSASPHWPTVLAANDWYWNTFLGEPVQPPDDPSVVFYRAVDGGQRTQTDKTEAQHLVVGAEGALAGWDYRASLTHSVNRQRTILGRGWFAATPFQAALDSGVIDPFAPPGGQTPAGAAAVQAALIPGFWEGGRTTFDMIELKGTGELMTLPTGALSAAAGIGYSIDRFEKTASAIAQGIGDTRFGDDDAIIPYTAKRKSWGVFGELVAPLTRTLEVSGALRHDDYSDFGGATTGKLTARWQPARGVLLRGAVGTGFKAPTVAQVNATRQPFGVTIGQYTCGPELAAVAAGLGAECLPGSIQYNVFTEGNRGLKPERSQQWSLGFRVEPVPALSVGADLWHVRLRNAIGQVDESVIFDDPAARLENFTTYVDPLTGRTLLAVLLNNVNLGSRIERGIDVDATLRLPTPLGALTSRLALSYHLKNRYQFADAGPYLSSLARYGPDGQVTFRWQGRLATTLEQGAFAHTLAVHFKSGYRDQTYSAADGVIFDPVTFETFDYAGTVKRFVGVDWQTQWRIGKGLNLTAGVINLFDRDPPRSLKTAGGGQMLGYDDRYYDARGRTLYASLAVRF